MRTKIIPSGYTLQLYRGSSGFTFGKLNTEIERYKSYGITGIAPHGFVGDLNLSNLNFYTVLSKYHNMRCYAAFGLSPYSATTKGIEIGKVAQHPDCAGVLFDEEGAFETEDGKKAALEIGQGFLSQFVDKKADVWVCDQPWSRPTLHWSKFPWEEISSYVDAHASQFYFNDYPGTQRYKHLNPIFHHEWDLLNVRLQKTNNVRPLVMTLQAYGWKDIFPDYIDCLLANPTAFLWCDNGLPSENALLGLNVVQQLKLKGFVGPTAVKDFQVHYNQNNPARKIEEDGRCGYNETVTALGIIVTDEAKNS